MAGKPTPPLPKQGKPDSITCRHCGSNKVRISDALLCRECDSPKPESGPTIVPTWMKRCS